MTLMVRSSVVLAAIVATSLLAPSVQAAGEGNACTSSYEKAQYLRRDKKLRAARKELLTCSQTTCAAAIVSDCTQWMTEVDKIIPSVVFDARDSKGQSVAGVKVSMDGEMLQSRLDGTAVQVDPGTHTFRFEPEQGTPGEQQVLVLEGEKARVITFAMTGPVAAGGDAGNDNKGKEEPAPAGSSSGSGQKTLAYVVGGVGVAALATGIIFGALGSSQASSDKGSGGCAPSCGNDEVSSIKTKLIVSDIFIPVGVVGIGAAVVLYLTAGSSKASTTTGLNHVTRGVRFDASPTKTGASFGLSGTF